MSAVRRPQLRRMALVPERSRIPHLAYSIALRRSSRAHSKTASAQDDPRCAPQMLGVRNAAVALSIANKHTLFTNQRRSYVSLPPSRTAPRPIARPQQPIYRPSTSDESKNAVGRSMNFFLKVAALFTASASLYIAYTITTYIKAVNAYYEDDPEIKDRKDPYTAATSKSPSKRRLSKIPEGADMSSRYDDWARDYDKEVGTQEKWMLMGLLRKRLVRDTRVAGNVLEVGAGTGRNLKWYNLSEMDRDDEHKSAGRISDMQRGVQSLTFVDKSPNMLALARNKWDDMFDKESLEGRYKTDKERGRWGENAPRLHWVQADVAVRRVVPRPADGFDAVIQTMGLCSYADPVGALRSLGGLVRQPGEGKGGGDEVGGSIHLLEHGKSHYEWLNKILDLAAPMHADRYGCWWNRDIAEIVRKSGLQVERIRRYHLGTTWEVILRPAESRKVE